MKLRPGRDWTKLDKDQEGNGIDESSAQILQSKQAAFARLFCWALALAEAQDHAETKLSNFKLGMLKRDGDAHSALR